MNWKPCFILAFFLLPGWNISAQKQALDLIAGAVYPIRTGDQAGNAVTKTGLTFGLLFRKMNEKGELWSAGALYQLHRSVDKVTVNNKEEKQTDRYEMFHVHGSPLVWFLDKKKRGFVEAGVFVNYLLHQETELKGNLVNNTKILQRTSLGPCLGIGMQLGESLRKSIVIGLRDDYAAVSFGKKPSGSKAVPLKFNTISLYIGLGI